MNETGLEQLTAEVERIARAARVAGLALAAVPTEAKNRAIAAVAQAVRARSAEIVAENAKDVAASKAAGRPAAMVDRLTLTPDRVKAMADGLDQMVALADPVGEVVRDWTPPSGVRIRQVRVPIGVVAMIYESRPNVTAEAAGLCLKSGNTVILRGGSEALHSNTILVGIIAAAVKAAGLPDGSVQMLPPQDRRSTTVLSRQRGFVDLVIARGSEQMIAEVAAQATVPVLGHGKGVCHVYIDQAADVEKAVRIAVNAKVHRPGVCNAMETLLVHQHLMYDVLPRLAKEYGATGVEMRGDERVAGMVSTARKAVEADWATEYLDKIVSIRVVDSLDEAIEHVNRYGSGHTDSIVTEDRAAADRFQKMVDSACVMVNASTRLHDGGVFGFGSEIGISTNKLHARGTMGLRELTTTKYLVDGAGQIRE